MTLRSKVGLRHLAMRLTSSNQKFLFLLMITAVYTALVVWLDFLQGPYWWDERTFWQTSLSFSDRLFPRLDQLRDYNELNTPLPFVIFGSMEYLLGGGIAVGRLLNLVLSIITVLIIGWPTQQKSYRAILCVIGLFMCPYYLWLSGRLYTEMIACFWVLMGLVGYVRERKVLSCVAFVLAIASRQYMVAFPAAIFIYETISFCIKAIRERRVELRALGGWLSPLIALVSIFGWFYAFGGLTPQTAVDVRLIPEVQETAWAVMPGGGINFLAFVSLYIVIPEFLLLERSFYLDLWRQRPRQLVWITLGLLLYCLVFPPLLIANGNLSKVIAALPSEALSFLLLYSLALLACIRFSRLNLLSLLVFFNALMMIKAFPWDRYVLPLVVAFWYIKAYGLEEKFAIRIADSELPNLESAPSGGTSVRRTTGFLKSG